MGNTEPHLWIPYYGPEPYAEMCKLCGAFKFSNLPGPFATTNPSEHCLARAYDSMYRQKDHFRYRAFVYKRFLKWIIRKAGLQPRASVLDVGCGQGFFSSLFFNLGHVVTGVDFSAEGIRTARSNYPRIQFEVGDCLRLPFLNQFDTVFVRAWSPYNVAGLAQTEAVTDTLLSYLKVGGVLIFAYPSNQCSSRMSTSWIHHSLAETRSYFSGYAKSKVYYSLRVIPVPSPVAFSASKLTGIGGELVGLVWKESMSAAPPPRPNTGATTELVSSLRL